MSEGEIHAAEDHMEIVGEDHNEDSVEDIRERCGNMETETIGDIHSTEEVIEREDNMALNRKGENYFEEGESFISQEIYIDKTDDSMESGEDTFHIVSGIENTIEINPMTDLSVNIGSQEMNKSDKGLETGSDVCRAISTQSIDNNLNKRETLVIREDIGLSLIHDGREILLEAGVSNIGGETSSLEEIMNNRSGKFVRRTRCRRVSWSGSGVWERSDDKRWEVVEMIHHKIPSRAPIEDARGEVSPSLGIQPFLASFTEEEINLADPDNIITDGTSLVRLEGGTGPIQEDDEVVEEAEVVEAAETSNRSAKRRRWRRNNSRRFVRGDEIGQSQSQGETRRRRRWQWWCRRKRIGLTFPGHGTVSRPYMSVESSPGRDSPSPDSLQRILARRNGNPEIVPECQSTEHVHDSKSPQYIPGYLSPNYVPHWHFTECIPEVPSPDFIPEAPSPEYIPEAQSPVYIPGNEILSMLSGSQK